MCGLVDLPKGVTGDELVPGFLCALPELMIVAEVGGIVVVFNEVEVSPCEEVHVVGDVGELLELLGAAAVVVIAGSEVEVEQPKWKGGVAVSCPSFKAEALGLALKVGAEGFVVGVVVVACLW